MPCVQEGAAAEAATTATAAPTAPTPGQQRWQRLQTRAKQESNTASSRSDHDVGRRCRGNVIFTRSSLPCACKAAFFIAEALLGCAAEELIQKPQAKHGHPKRKPEIAQCNIPIILQHAQDEREERENTGCKNDETAEEKARQAPLALANHRDG
mmetsp:Transcript_85551/g.164704  ORF Transcript_85551/g.164704 Transcript_85551/m.164704 type:complete len:154 (-) Transcript_85551:73-534(-)